MGIASWLLVGVAKLVLFVMFLWNLWSAHAHQMLMKEDVRMSLYHHDVSMECMAWAVVSIMSLMYVELIEWKRMN